MHPTLRTASLSAHTPTPTPTPNAMHAPNNTHAPTAAWDAWCVQIVGRRFEGSGEEERRR
eukprot:286580-Rhodomonas_salina.2